MIFFFLITTCPPNMCTRLYQYFIGSIYFWYVWDEQKLLIWLVSYFLKIWVVAVQPLSSLNLWHFSLCVNVTVMIKEVTDHFAGDECDRRWRIDVCQSLADVKGTKEMLITQTYEFPAIRMLVSLMWRQSASYHDGVISLVCLAHWVLITHQPELCEWKVLW